MRAIASIEDNKLHGRRLDAAVAMELPGDAATRPWQAVITSGEAKLGVQVHLGSGAERKTGNMNCTPILDGRGKVRGCLVAVSDVTAIEKSNDQLRRALAQLELSSARVETQNQDLIRLAMYDGLTSLHNRGAFFQAAREAVARQAATGSTVAVLMIDVDHFKSFNDRFGHATGDIVLQRVAKCLADTIRFNDLAGRYGGEEFCALVENLDRAGVLALAERIRKTIQAQAGLGVGEGAGLSVTVSIGVAISPPAAGELAGLIKLADEALYASKHGGRNRVTLSGAAEPMGRDQAGTGQADSAISLGEGVSRA
jgi:diguanylate cyclase (GGDEF)-like protein